MREKHIEEMAKDICSIFRSIGFSRGMASILYDKGYRKRRRGEWVENCFGGLNCTVCGLEQVECIGLCNYCPDCGAEMKGGSEE